MSTVETTFIDTACGKIACHETGSGRQTVVLVHGNSASAKAYERQLTSPLAERYRLVAIDLPGHGQSDDATDLSVYSIPGYARILKEVAARLGLDDAVYVGWSLGGHIVLETAEDFPAAPGFVIFGTPPLAFPPAMDQAFLPHPAMRYTFAPMLTREEAIDYVTAAFAPGYANVPPGFVEDALRTDGRARASLADNIQPIGYRDEVDIVACLTRPLAVLHGAAEQLVNGAYIAALTMPTLWRGKMQIIEGSGHASQWERPEAFNALLAAFLAETS